MAHIEYGHTWWGQRWLEALSQIDFDNRLPRGKRYARNGSVQSITADSSSIAARVKGTQPRPYKVELKLWSFSEAKKRTIESLVRTNPYYLAQLEARILPPELEQALAEKNIRLFPENWKELKMKCSCPDWAVPCKHLAAVVYIIANEIDKNPFLVFQLHDFDLLQAIHGEDSSADDEILDMESLVASDSQQYNYYQDKLEHIDLSQIPDLYPASSQLLTPVPLFYLKNDFKEILLKAYRQTSRKLVRYTKTLEIEEHPPKLLYTSFTLGIHKGKFFASGKLKKGQNELAFDTDDLAPLVMYVHQLSVGDLSVYPPVVSFLIMVHNFALHLMEQQACIPDILSIKKGAYCIRWIPGLYNPQISSIFNDLVAALPRELVFYGNQALEQREQVLFLLAFFLQHYWRQWPPIKEHQYDDEGILELFFAGQEYRPGKFEQQANAHTIRLWLGRFFIRPEHHYPVIVIEETGSGSGSNSGVGSNSGFGSGTFHFSIQVGDKRNPDELPSGFQSFLAEPDSITLPLLRDLSLLASYLPVVKDYLQSPQGIELDPADFVDQWFAALKVFQILGVKTLVPRQLQQVFVPALSLKIRARTEQNPSLVSYTSLSSMLDFEWTLSAGDSHISPEEILSLKKRYGNFILYKDRYLELDDKLLESISRQLEKDPRPSNLQLLQTGLTGLYEGSPIQGDETFASLFQSLIEPAEADVPENLKAQLRPYQLRGYKWLCHNHRIGLGSIVADDMGLGKTLQVITFLLQLHNDGILSPQRPALIVVPASLLTNWIHEIDRFAPDLAARIYHGNDRNLELEADIVLTTYALARSDASIMKKGSWSVLILDEAQNIKNSGSNQTKAIKSIPADYYLAMTGTPVENRLMDYWSLIDFVMKGYVGSQKTFKDAFAAPIERYRDQQALDTFKKITAPIMLRRLKTDRTIIQDLPEKIITNRFPTLTKEQIALYQEVVDQAENLIGSSEGIQRSGLVFKLMLSLKQICCHPALHLKRGEQGAAVSGKALLLIELVESIVSKGEKVLVFTQFAEMGHLLQSILSEELDTPSLFLHGGTTRKERDRIVQEFQEDLDTRILILSIKAGGVGLNLTAANHVIHYDLWWNPAVENQATDRAFRIGQKKNVTVYRFITQGTYEDKINAMLEAKEELAQLTVSQGEQWLTKLNTKDLKDLLSLT